MKTNLRKERKKKFIKALNEVKKTFIVLLRIQIKRELDSSLQPRTILLLVFYTFLDDMNLVDAINSVVKKKF